MKSAPNSRANLDRTLQRFSGKGAAERRAKLHVLHVLHGQKRNLKQPHLVPQRNITARAVISRFGLSFFSSKRRAGELTNHRRMCYHTVHLLWDTNDVER